MADNNAIVNTEPTVVDTENPADELESGASGINPVVNTSPTTSETPSNLVEKGENGKLSPNPAGFGFTKQVTVNTLSSPGSPDTLYLVPQYDGEGHVKEYYKYRWDVAAFAFKRIFEPVNNVKFEEGEHATPVVENTAPQAAPEKVFTGEVVFNQEPTIEGKKLHDWVDSEGGVTHEELDSALSNYYKKGQVDTKLDAKQNTLNETSAPSGVAVKLLGFDSQGHVVSDDVPEGIVVDDALDTESNNAIANAPVAEALEEKANVDGNYPTMTVGVADNLSPYDEESGEDQDEPFDFQATGTANGTDPTFATGSIGLLKQKQGNTVVVNQLLQNPNFSSTSNWNVNNASTGSIAASNNVLTYTAIVKSSSNSVYQNTKLINGHKYLFIGNFVSSSNTSQTRVAIYKNSLLSIKTFSLTANTKTEIRTIFENTLNSGDTTFYVYCDADTGINVNETLSISNFAFIDLTQWFNGDVPSDLESHPENFFRYYQGSLAYNTGELVNANGRYIKCVGRNQFDGTNDVKVVPNSTYYIYGSATLTYKDKDGNTISSESKTNETFNIPANCLNVGVSGTGDICISIYYEGESGYDQYYPYEVLTNNDTGTEVLRSAGSGLSKKKDYKTADGTINRLCDDYTFTGSESWSFNSTDNYFYFSSSINAVNGTGTTTCSNGVIVTVVNNSILRVYLSVNPQLSSSSNMNTVFPSGAKINYQKLEPTTEQGTSYSENLVIDDFGSQSFEGTSGVPQGALIFYPVDYKAFLDTLYDYSSGDPDNLAKKTDVSTEATARETEDTVLQNAIGGTLRQCLCLKETLDFDDTDYVDLGALNWSWNDGANFKCWYSNDLNALAEFPALGSQLGKFLTTSVKTIIKDSFFDGLTVGFSSSDASASTKSVFVRNGSSTEKPTGLLAYKKASE